MEKVKEEEKKMNLKDEIKEWIEAIVIGAIAGPFLFHFLPFAKEWYAVWLEFLCVTFFWRVVIRKKTFHVSKNTREWIEVFVVAGILALNIRTFVIQPYKIPSLSMYPLFDIKDHLFVTRFNYWAKLPHRGDVIVFQYPVDPKKDFIKRVIAVEGDTLTVKNKQVFVNNEQLTEPYTVYIDPNLDWNNLPLFPEWTRDNFGPFVIPKDYVFAMGDNRDNSLDSRYWGPLHWRRLKGKAIVLYWPFKRAKLIK